ncbi:MAG: hypothetical protein GF364_11695 [Candidatus Lokiarchaeota archaeon]|nr:hypothetical protein [Candidatus Lokiarchaeota archaeon]
MANYILGIISGVLAGLCNFSGKVLQKKAINDTPEDTRNNELVKSMVKNPLWLFGMILGIGISTIFLFIAQGTIGAALIPGLSASGLIVLAIGSTKILNEKLEKWEIIAIILLFIAILLIGLSELSIEADLSYFEDIGFSIRFSFFTIIGLAMWFILYFGGKKAEKFNSIYLAVGTAFPFVIGNLWLQPFIVSISEVFSGSSDGFVWFAFLIGIFMFAGANVLGIGHSQHALNSGNASIVVPIQQVPQQIAPIIIYYGIYQFSSPHSYSLATLIIGIIFIVVSAVILGKKQAMLEKIKVD